MWHFERGEFRGKTAEKIEKKGVDKVFIEYIKNLHKQYVVL